MAVWLRNACGSPTNWRLLKRRCWTAAARIPMWPCCSRASPVLTCVWWRSGLTPGALSGCWRYPSRVPPRWRPRWSTLLGGRLIALCGRHLSMDLLHVQPLELLDKFSQLRLAQRACLTEQQHFFTEHHQCRDRADAKRLGDLGLLFRVELGEGDVGVFGCCGFKDR